MEARQNPGAFQLPTPETAGHQRWLSLVGQKWRDMTLGQKAVRSSAESIINARADGLTRIIQPYVAQYEEARASYLRQVAARMAQKIDEKPSDS